MYKKNDERGGRRAGKAWASSRHTRILLAFVTIGVGLSLEKWLRLLFTVWSSCTAAMATAANPASGVPADSVTTAAVSPPSSTKREASRSLHAFNATYVPAPLEDYIMSHLKELGYQTPPGKYARGCDLWNGRKAQHPYSPQLALFKGELRRYAELFHNFVPQPDIRHALRTEQSLSQTEICRRLEINDEGGFEALFPSGLLSWSANVGYAEPLFPPLRHPRFCSHKDRESSYNLGYLLHDFGHLCRRLASHSRIVLLDMGASLSYHGWAGPLLNPPLYLMATFRKFGLPFDHIYAYEVTPTPPADVYQSVPPEFLPAYHWFNVGVTANRTSPQNPLNLLKRQFTSEDLVVVKLDIDTPHIELPLVNQILEDPELAPLVDLFYFEHHVHLRELKHSWLQHINGSVADSLVLFRKIREKGIMAHSWV